MCALQCFEAQAIFSDGILLYIHKFSYVYYESHAYDGNSLNDTCLID